MRQTLNIFLLKMTILRNRLVRSTLMDTLKFAVLFVFVVFYCAGGQYALVIFFNKLREVPNLAELMISKLWVSQIMQLLFTAFTPFLVFGGIVSFAPTFFNKKELTFNMINYRSLFPLFVYDYFEIVLKNFAFIFIAISPLLVAYGRLFGSSYRYYIAAPAVIFLFAVILVSSGLLLSFLIMWAAPRTKALAAINLTTVAASVFLIYYLVLANPVNIIGKDFVSHLLEYARQLRQPLSSYSIPVVTNLVFVGIVYGKTGIAVINFLKLFAAAALVLAVNVTLGYSIFSKKIVSVMEEPGSGFASVLKFSHGRNQLFIKAVKNYPVAFKEMMYLLRDQTILLQLLTILVLAAAFLINIARVSGLDASSSIFYVRLSYPATVLLLTVFAGRLVFPSVSSEGRNIWLIKLSPHGIKKFIFTKFLLLFLMQFFFSMAFLLAVNFMNGFGGAFYVVFNFAFLVSAMMTTVGFALGTLLADFSESDPWRIATGFGGVLFFIACFTLSLFPILLAVISYKEHGYRMTIVRFSSLLSVVSVFVSYFVLSRMIRRLELKEI